LQGREPTGDWLRAASEPFLGGKRLARLEAGAALSLYFRSGERPDADGLERALSDAASGRSAARISHRPDDEPGWLELLASGMTLDVSGLAPVSANPVSLGAIRYGFDEGHEFEGLEAIAIVPGPHLASAGGMQPVVRAMCEVAAGLCASLAVKAVGYGPAETLMDPGYFVRIVRSWLDGGPFPALGLTALIPASDGGVRSRGLAHFIGHEVQLQPAAGDTPPETLRSGIRVVDHLVRAGVPGEPVTVELGDGDTISIEPSRFGKLLLAWRGA